MIRCAECNEENMDGLEYCDSCGAKLEAVDADGSADVSDTPNAAKEESTVPVEEIEEIVEIEGVSTLVLGATDLSLEMGHSGNTGHADVQAGAG